MVGALAIGLLLGVFAKMRNKIKHMSYVLSILLSITSLRQCRPLIETEDSSEYYYFLEYIHQMSTTQIEDIGIFVNIDPASYYRFDDKSGMLEIVGQDTFDISNDFPLFVGFKYVMTGEAGEGMIGFVQKIPSLPHTSHSYSPGIFENSDSLYIVGIDEEGTILLHYRSHEISLAPGEHWSISGVPRIRKFSGISVQVTDTYILRNRGRANRLKIRFIR